MITPLGSPVVASPDNPSPDGQPTDEEALASHAMALADGIERALPSWVVRCVVERADAWQPGLGRALLAPAREAGERAVEDVGSAVRALLALDVDQQPTGPLAVVRRAVGYPTGVLAEAGVPHIVRDEFDEQAFPDDGYGLTPASFADLDPDLRELGLVWGAAKAHVVLARRRAEGKR
jgi:hypothetical protein